jgi:hypothetical protein
MISRCSITICQNPAVCSPGAGIETTTKGSGGVAGIGVSAAGAQIIANRVATVSTAARPSFRRHDRR